MFFFFCFDLFGSIDLAGLSALKEVQCVYLAGLLNIENSGMICMQKIQQANACIERSTSSFTLDLHLNVAPLRISQETVNAQELAGVELSPQQTSSSKVIIH